MQETDVLAIEYFDRAVKQYPNRTAVTDGVHSYTYDEVYKASVTAAHALVANGVGPGSRVAILSPNHPAVLACQYAILRAGCVLVSTNYRNPAADTRQQLSFFGVSWVFYHSSLYEDLDAIRSQLNAVLGFVPLEAATQDGPPLSAWASSVSGRTQLPDTSMDDMIYLGCTGGTTGGGMKGVVHTNRTWELNIANSYALFQFKAPIVHLVVAPLTHAAGVFHWTLVGRGATHVLCPAADPKTICTMIEVHKATFVFLPPTVVYMLLAFAERVQFDLSSLEYLVIGAAPVSRDKLKEAVHAFGPVVCVAYGSMETLLMNMFLSREDVADAAAQPAHVHRLASIGREGPLNSVEIMDDGGTLLNAGERGEMVIRSGSVMREYYQDPERTALSRAYGWHHTGDVGWRDADGYIYLVDRKNDVIISGGFNIYPGEVEQVVMSHPAVQDCAVVGVPHEKWGELVLAAVELKPGAAFDDVAFIDYCKERLGSLRAPKAVEVLAQMPRSPVGKTLRRVVRARHWEQYSRKI